MSHLIDDTFLPKIGMSLGQWIQLGGLDTPREEQGEGPQRFSFRRARSTGNKDNNSGSMTAVSRNDRVLPQVTHLGGGLLRFQLPRPEPTGNDGKGLEGGEGEGGLGSASSLTINPPDSTSHDTIDLTGLSDDTESEGDHDDNDKHLDLASALRKLREQSAQIKQLKKSVEVDRKMGEDNGKKADRLLGSLEELRKEVQEWKDRMTGGRTQ